MPRTSSLKPKKSIDSPNRPWCVDVPPSLSETNKRQRLFFETLAEAKLTCEKFKTRRENFGVSLTAMSPARIAEAAEAFKLLDGLNVSLLDAVKDYARTHKARTASVTFRDLCNAYIDSRSPDKNPEYLRGLRNCRDRFPDLHERLVCDITHHDLDGLLAGISNGGRNLLLRHFRSFFNFGIKKGYLAENPVSRVDFAEVRRKEVETISNGDVAAMLNDALVNDLELLPVLTLGFFCGIRPEGEMTKLEWKDIDLVDRVVTMRPEITKTNRRRFINLSANACQWLSRYTGDRSGLVVKIGKDPLLEHRKANRERAGVTRWPNSAMRHTFCSNWLAEHGDINQLTLMSGHTSVDTMWRHYHRAVRKEDAKVFWHILPPKVAENVIPMSAAV